MAYHDLNDSNERPRYRNYAQRIQQRDDDAAIEAKLVVMGNSGNAFLQSLLVLTSISLCFHSLQVSEKPVSLLVTPRIGLERRLPQRARSSSRTRQTLTTFTSSCKYGIQQVCFFLGLSLHRSWASLPVEVYRQVYGHGISARPEGLDCQILHDPVGFWPIHSLPTSRHNLDVEKPCKCA